jgi:hypothetical protein
MGVHKAVPLGREKGQCGKEQTFWALALVQTKKLSPTLKNPQAKLVTFP